MAIKLVVFDFDGTLADFPFTSLWKVIDNVLGCEHEDRMLSQDYFSGRIDLVTWAKSSMDVYKKYGMNKSRFEEILESHLKLIPGAKELFDELKKLGKKTAIVSGSFLNAYDFWSEKYKIKADYVGFECEIFFDGDGKISGADFNDIGFEGKVDAIEKICEQCGVKMAETAMVGDADNDVFAFRKVGLPISFNSASAELDKAAKFVVKEKDLRKIIPLLTGQ
jgi:phosphoserine phosphatase